VTFPRARIAVGDSLTFLFGVPLARPCRGPLSFFPEIKILSSLPPPSFFFPRDYLHLFLASSRDGCFIVQSALLIQISFALVVPPLFPSPRVGPSLSDMDCDRTFSLAFAFSPAFLLRATFLSPSLAYDGFCRYSFFARLASLATSLSGGWPFFLSAPFFFAVSSTCCFFLFPSFARACRISLFGSDTTIPRYVSRLRILTRHSESRFFFFFYVFTLSLEGPAPTTSVSFSPSSARSVLSLLRRHFGAS